MNNIIQLLFDLEISDNNSLSIFHSGTRDNEDINVLRCKKSGVLVLDKICTSEEFYKNNIHYNEKIGTTHLKDEIVASKPLEDDFRRFDQNKLKFKDKKILDFGCGQGGFIKLVDKVTKTTTGIELNKKNRNNLRKIGYDIREDISQLKNYETFDYIILNHVFEHLNQPIDIMKKLKQHLRLDGEIIIEIPHAKDFLMNTLNNKNFKKFTFWSEHLILHTKDSLEKFLIHSGFKKKKIVGFQRYPLSNHIYWMSMGNQEDIKFLIL